RLLVSCSDDASVRFWDPETGVAERVLNSVHRAGIFSVAVNHQAGLMATASWDTSVVVWSIERMTPVRPLNGHREPVMAAIVTDDGDVVSASMDSTIKIWNVQTGRCRETLTGHHGWVTALADVPSRGLLLSGADDRTIKAWHLPTRQRAAT